MTRWPKHLYQSLDPDCPPGRRVLLVTYMPEHIYRQDPETGKNKWVHVWGVRICFEGASTEEVEARFDIWREGYLEAISKRETRKHAQKRGKACAELTRARKAQDALWGIDRDKELNV